MTTASKPAVRKTGSKPSKTAASASRHVPSGADSRAGRHLAISSEAMPETPAVARIAAPQPLDRQAADSASTAAQLLKLKPRGQRIGYTRVSSVDQNDARQLDGVQDLDRVFHDHASGKDTDRPQLRLLLAHLRDGDHLLVHSLDRLARSLADLQQIVETLTGKGVTVEFVKEHLIFNPPRATGEPHRAAYSMLMLMLQMLGAVSQFERSLIRERQREGIALAKSRAYIGDANRHSMKMQQQS